MKVSKHYIILTTAIMILLCFPSLSFSRAEERKEVSYNLNMDGKVYLENIAGNISVAGWDRNQIRIEAIKKSKRERDLDNVSIDIHQYDEGNIRIITRHRKTISLFGSTKTSVHYDILIPNLAQMRIKTISGDITARGIGGFLNISTVSGELEVVAAGNGIKYSSVSGDIDLKGITGNIDLKTVSGDITIDDIRGSVVAKTVSGEIEIDDLSDADEVVLDTTSGEVELIGEISLGSVYDINTFSGDIEMIFPPGSNFELQTKTSSGRVDIDFELMVTGNISRKKVQGIVGDGGAHINISTFSGDIDITKR